MDQDMTPRPSRSRIKTRVHARSESPESENDDDVEPIDSIAQRVRSQSRTRAPKAEVRDSKRQRLVKPEDADDEVSDSEDEASASSSPLALRRSPRRRFGVDDSISSAAAASAASASVAAPSGDETDLSLSEMSDADDRLARQSTQDRYESLKGRKYALNTHLGLKKLLKEASSGGGFAGRNTHIAFRGPGDAHYTIISQRPTNIYRALARNVRLSRKYFGRPKRGQQHPYPHTEIGADLEIIRAEGQHAEQVMIELLKTRLGKTSHVGILKGYKVVVDKPACQQCFELLKEAGLTILRDGTRGMSDPTNSRRRDYTGVRPDD